MLIEPGYNTTNKLFALVWSFVALPVGSCDSMKLLANESVADLEKLGSSALTAN